MKRAKPPGASSDDMPHVPRVKVAPEVFEKIEDKLRRLEPPTWDEGVLLVEEIERLRYWLEQVRDMAYFIPDEPWRKYPMAQAAAMEGLKGTPWHCPPPVVDREAM